MLVCAAGVVAVFSMALPSRSGVSAEGASAQPKQVVIEMVEGEGGAFHFSPAIVSDEADEIEVTFRNSTATTHNARDQDSSQFFAPDLTEDEAVWAFKDPGVYNFYCTNANHGFSSPEPDPDKQSANQPCKMCGQVIVGAAQPPATSTPEASSSASPTKKPAASGAASRPPAPRATFGGVFFTPVPTSDATLAPLAGSFRTPELATPQPLRAGTLSTGSDDAESRNRLALIATATFLMSAAALLLQRGFLR